MFDAILEGLKLLGVVQPGDAIYAITDGGENASHAPGAQTKEALLQSGVRLFVFLLTEPLPPSPQDDNMDAFLEMVHASGGFLFGIPGRNGPFAATWGFDYTYDKDSRDKVSMYTKELNIQVGGFWTLELAAPSSKKEEKLKLEVVDHEGRTRKDVWVTSPRALPAAK